jgi:hypothetical protein
MDKQKFEKMVEIMKGCCTDEGGVMDCCSMMRKMMMGYGERKETDKKNKENDTEINGKQGTLTSCS